MIVQGTTKVFAILGDPVSHSLSPQLHNAALTAVGINGIYVPFHVVPEQLATAVAGVRALQIAGLSVTVPHKERIIPLLDEIDPAAQRIGAVNTVVNREGRLIGYNTDAPGFLQALRDTLDFSPLHKEVLLIGAGGAARAALIALAQAGATTVVVANRTPDRAVDLIASCCTEFPACQMMATSLDALHTGDFLGRADLLVNTSALGLAGESFPSAIIAGLKPSALIFDMVYSRTTASTPLVRQGESAGHRAADGRSMLIAQGEAAFSLWTGLVPPGGVMKAALNF
ncbi:MAG: shikimate dehydrogenase [Deltaproteobacteria bacterium HGW-Deltaproteobacteria-4]|nr:MAG: shikimate dehydrogenase [Deltaproteobacteria bacterium HGW-Deltaproteobacteria-4]